MIPTYKYITLQELVALTKVDLRIVDNNTEDLFLRRQILQAANKMGTKLDYLEKTATINICDNVAELPCDFVTFDRGNIYNPPIVFTTNGQADTSTYCSNFSVTYTGGPFITCTPYQVANTAWGVPVINIQDGKLYFSTNVDANECTISYLAINADANGKIKIPELNERAITSYAMYRYYLQTGAPQSMWAEHFRIWKNCKLAARGQSKLLDSVQRDLLYRIMNSLF